jgi:hypothetical protein
VSGRAQGATSLEGTEGGWGGEGGEVGLSRGLWAMFPEERSRGLGEVRGSPLSSLGSEKSSQKQASPEG